MGYNPSTNCNDSRIHFNLPAWRITLTRILYGGFGGCGATRVVPPRGARLRDINEVRGIPGI